MRRREQRNTQGRTGRAAMVLAAENRTIGSGENKKSGGEDKITILSAVRASIPKNHPDKPDGSKLFRGV